MARSITAVNGYHASGDAPPPSTLAAQIIRNQTRAATSVKQADGANTFAPLLHEILHNQAATLETDVRINAQLVDVVAEAGLSVLTLDDPFAQWDILIPQATDSIAVIELTIKRQPEVLLVTNNADGPPLSLCLLARLAAVCGRPRCQSLPVVNLLDSIMKSLRSSLELWPHAETLQNVLKESVVDVLSALEMISKFDTTLTVQLPPARSVAQLWPRADGIIVMPQGCQTGINNCAHALTLAASLIQAECMQSTWSTEAHTRLCRLLATLQPSLDKSGSTSSVVIALLQSETKRSRLIALQSVFESIRPHCLLDSAQEPIAQALLGVLPHSSHSEKAYLIAAVRAFVQQDDFTELGPMLRSTILAVLSSLCSEEEMPTQILALRRNVTNGDMMLDGYEQLLSLDGLSTLRPVDIPQSRAKKRRRTDDIKDPGRQELVGEVTKLLTGAASENMSFMSETATNLYRNLTEDKQCTVWTLLTRLVTTDLEAATQTILELAQMPEVKGGQRARILSVLAIRECVQRSSNKDTLDLARSKFGQICLRALQSSTREVRMAAVQSLSAFLRSNIDQEITLRNRNAALGYLRKLSTRDKINEHETCIAAWGQIAVACEGQELNLALLSLVQYLGHPNPLVCGLAFQELEFVAASKGVTRDELFRPFWSTIAISVVQDLHIRPQKAQQMCDLLGIDISTFLILTQRETVPTLVLTKKKDVLKKIADARGGGASVQDICLQPRTNLAATLALLLSQSSRDIEETVMGCLAGVAPDFTGTDLAHLVKMDSTLIACEMLKQAGEEDQKRKSRAHQAFQVFADLAEREPGKKKAHSSTARTVTGFFEKNILGILTHYSAVLENVNGVQAVSEKIRCLQAIAEMVKIAKSNASTALPQIRACLQSAVAQPELCEAALLAWLDLISVLPTNGIASIVDQTFALIVQHWNELSPDMHRIIHEAIAKLVREHNGVIRENVATLPSLGNIPLLSKFNGEFERLKLAESVESQCRAFAKRLSDESKNVVLQALVELVQFLEQQQDFICDTAASEQPIVVLSELLRSLLDATAKYASNDQDAAELCARCLGMIGCVDPNRVDASKKKRQVLVLSNFDKAVETVDWVCVFMEEVLVKTFRSTNNARAQGYLAYVIQELLRFCDFNEASLSRLRASSQTGSSFQRWQEIPGPDRITLTPFLTSRYHITVNANVAAPARPYPSFSPDIGHGSWLRGLVYDLLWRAKGDNTQMVFPLLARIIRGHDIAIPTFLLPYATLNVVLGGTVAEVDGIRDELLSVLQAASTSSASTETIRRSSENVFGVLDYMTAWLQEKKKLLGDTRANAFRTGHSPGDFDEIKDMHQIENIDKFLNSIPAEVIAVRAVECGSYARALFHWEQYIRQRRPLIPPSSSYDSNDDDYARLQEIYAHIDDPDGLEGIASRLTLVSEEQQATQHARAGRWPAAQAWYELQLAEDASQPKVETQVNLLECLRETGQYSTLMRYADSFLQSESKLPRKSHHALRISSLATEACWMTGNLSDVKTRLKQASNESTGDLSMGIGRLLVSIEEGRAQDFRNEVQSLRLATMAKLATTGMGTLQACHEDLRKLHVLHEVELLSLGGATRVPDDHLDNILDKRIAVIGSYISDKQYLLGARRAVMSLDHGSSARPRIAASWLTTARLARKANNTTSAYNAVLQASKCGDRAAQLEEARLLWHDGHRRQAIQSLESAISLGVFELPEPMVVDHSGVTDSFRNDNMLAARAQLLLAKWLDVAGQSQARDMTVRYQSAAKTYQRWEKGHYYLGKHYSKLLDAEKALPKGKQGLTVQTGELTKLVVENLLRSVPFGNKYWHQSIPKVLTLWLDLGMECITKSPRENADIWDKRLKSLQSCHKHLAKYFDRIPPYVFYAAMPQMISRISHPHPEVWKQLSSILTRIGAAHPSQALWSLLAVAKASDRTRAERGAEIINRLKDPKAKARSDTGNVDLRMMIAQGQRLSDGLLQACEAHVEPRSSRVSLSKDLGFNHKLAPSSLVVPVETTLTPSLPHNPNAERIRRHKAFAQEKVAIQAFQDDVLVLSSLQRPRKVTVRGSDGKTYGLLCKPKDDLRKDQRLMEFNSMINRALKRDAESSKRRLYIKTYAVTPLSEESGTIEWVEGIKPIRDILLNLYNRKGIKPNYNDIKNILNEACKGPEYAHIFIDKVLNIFKPALHEWFTETYPESETWFAARLRYARSAAVMSMTGHVLGLGDRHGENILLQEGTGGVFHVDFNCLFDKGLTFEKPEVVPFRLTPNMVDAMGPYGYEGPFRKSCELTLGLLRQNKDTLMTILETFLYDPTTDFIGGKKKRSTAGVPETPQEILESVDAKLKGLLRGESVPLSVEGYVDALVREATSSWNLCQMYIGWCSFL